MTIGDRLTELRKSRGLSQEELAAQMALTRQTISKWELGQSSPDVEYVIALCDYFGVTTDYLLKGTEPEPQQERASAPAAAAPAPDRARTEKKEAYTMLFYLGLSVVLLAASVLLIIFVLSLIQPWETFIYNRQYTGFWGYVLGHDAQVWVYLMFALIAGGAGLSAFSVIKKLRAAEEPKA
ncbi:MAG: helix-turn-helix transcriptional regulator [Lachnospiraceae bacterium]|nr:helix-turn-helix transcriptional regulator [Lachnospiraceae bacterium]